jgi:hypothetical protein
LVAFSRDPVLAVWQAMKPLAEIGARTDASDIAKIVTEAEIILFGLVRALSRRLVQRFQNINMLWFDFAC